MRPFKTSTKIHVNQTTSNLLKRIMGVFTMRHVHPWLVLGIVAGLPFVTGCGQNEKQVEHPHPAEVEHIDGTELSRVTLTPDAMKRLGVETEEVVESKGSRNDESQLCVPFAALLYLPDGTTFVYKSPKPRVFVREPITVDYTEGDTVYLKEGPPVGTVVATVAAAEIYGTEFAVGH